MKIKFNNGYTVEIDDCKGMSYHEVRRRAYNAMKALMKDSKKVKDMPLLGDPRESIVTGVMTNLTNLKKAIEKYSEMVYNINMYADFCNNGGLLWRKRNSA